MLLAAGATPPLFIACAPHRQSPGTLETRLSVARLVRLVACLVRLVARLVCLVARLVRLVARLVRLVARLVRLVHVERTPRPFPLVRGETSE